MKFSKWIFRHHKTLESIRNMQFSSTTSGHHYSSPPFQQQLTTTLTHSIAHTSSQQPTLTHHRANTTWILPKCASLQTYLSLSIISNPAFSWRRAEYTVRNVETTTALFRANTSYMVVPASLLVIVTSYYPHHAKLQTSSKKTCNLNAFSLFSCLRHLASLCTSSFL